MYDEEWPILGGMMESEDLGANAETEAEANAAVATVAMRRTAIFSPML